MEVSDVYILAGIAIFIPWLLLLFAPYGRFTDRIVQLFAITCMVLGLIFIYRFFFSPDARAEIFCFECLGRLFNNENMVLSAWLNYLSFGLFAGLWIVHDGDGAGIPHFYRLIPLLLTFVAGPIGVVLYLLMRFVKTGKQLK
jgi:Domain of unknown function (DUF4281)